MLADFEVGDDTVLHRAEGLNIARCPSQHHLGFVADGDGLAGARTNGHDGRLAENDAAILEEDERVGGTEVDADGLRE